jgi:DNA-binding NtrC family response regulator
MSDGTGLDVLRLVRRLQPGCPVLLLTAFSTAATNAEALRLGAVTILDKPIGPKDLEAELRAAIAETAQLGPGADAANEAGLIGRSPPLQALLEMIVRVAPTDSSVLVTGESGTGKELVAQAIHRLSRRAMKPLVVVNCAAIPETLLESELFGHVKGAFTGALQSREGRFKLANGGTLFLDEMGDLPLALQAKLLRVLQEHTIEPLGSSRTEPVDFRLIAATNRDLEQMVAAGTFRRDLFYRLNVVPLELPPLRERPGDVPLLVRHFLNKLSTGGRVRVAQPAMDALSRYSWPGNVRELENLVERLVVLRGEGEIGVADLPEALRRPGAAPAPAGGAVTLTPRGIDLYAVMEELEDRLISEALELTLGNKQRAAQLLGLNRTTLLEKLKRRRAREGEPE